MRAGLHRRELPAVLLGALAAVTRRPALAETAPNLDPELGRVAFAGLVKMRAVTGLERIGDESPLFKPGQVLDTARAADGSAASISFSFPEAWILAGGPNLDVRDVKTSDSAFVLAAPLPRGMSLERLKDDFFLDVLFDPQGKYGAYGQVDDRQVTSSKLVPLTLTTGGQQGYRRIALKYAPLSYNQNTVERRALISATAVGGTVYMLVAGSLATRYKKMLPELAELQESFRCTGNTKAPAAAPS